MDERTHELQFKRIRSSGAQEWFCPVCRRRLLMQWPPSYEKQVLEPGDEHASHTGGRPGYQAGVPPAPMEPWLRWMRAAGLAGTGGTDADEFADR